MAGRKKHAIAPKLEKFMAGASKNEVIKCVPDRLSSEDDLGYIWFQCYCLLGLDRTLPKLVDFLLPLEPVAPISRNAYLTRVKRESVNNDWVARVKKYDAARILSATDTLIYTQQAIDAEWLDKGEKTRRIIQRSVEIAERIQSCSFKILDAVQLRIEALGSGDNHGGLGELRQTVNIVSEVATVTKTIQEILRNCWEGKEYTEAIQQLQQEILLIDEQNNDSATK